MSFESCFHKVTVRHGSRIAREAWDIISTCEERGDNGALVGESPMS